ETAGTPVIYLCGRVRTAALERALAAAGLDVGAVETYDTVPVHHTSDHVAHVTGWNPVWGTLVFSAVAAQQFAALRARSALALLFGNTRAFCISQRVAAALDGEMPAQRVAVAERPDEAALLDLLAAHT
ncbi:uroporphyrinogen-III synthase, partial [Aquibium sp. A9E412]|uniref:uroporphyrinogen-III synthase n=1 Tax=Aquibium sp. A9E412 TaxID=2976767 RepID=UPI0025B1F9B7